jgi:ubiquitin C-terminal hydrolase
MRHASIFYVLTIEQMESESKKNTMRGILGLANLGNTCYMNSAIQAFRHCPEWTIFCKKNGRLEESIETKDTNPAKIAYAYQDLLHSIWAGEGPGYVRPLGFYEQLKQIVKGTLYDDFIKHTPQDAHEFLVWLLDQMYIATQKQVSIQIKTPEKIPPMSLMAINGWKSAFEKQYSPLTDLIFGLFRVQYTCGGCKAVHTRWETFNTLKMSLSRDEEGKPQSILESLKKEFQEEDIDGYECDTCKQKTLTKKSVSIWRLPRVLILTIKRFTPFGTRENTPLKYGGEALNFGEVFSKESAEETKDKSYSLFATIDHHGHLSGGHYVSQCFNPVWKTWHLYDDETAHKLESPNFGPQTYILMFR